ncbi:MAG: DUF5683 domain-containing protein [candidate division Zixibacteria bacterium]|nr:DUF5683 domain-containing protein [candidate division Zixibacteria bacterium]
MKLAIVSILLLISATVTAQNTGDSKNEIVTDSLAQDSVLVLDTSIFLPGNIFSAYTKADDPRNFEKSLVQNPTKALFKSMIIPGWGQYGNKRKFKALLFFGLDIWFISSAINYGNQTSDFSNQYDAADINDISLRNDLYSKFLDRKDQRNKFTWFSVIVTFISMFDAFSDAHLSGFPKKEIQESLSFNYDSNREDIFIISMSYQF